MRHDLPDGTVTFLFTDVEGSTKLLHALGDEPYAEALAEHRAIIRAACVAEGGVEVDTQGDAFFFAFPKAPGAFVAAAELTERLATTDVRVRVGLHTGTPHVTAEGYVGADVHRAARIAASAHGGQVVLTSSTASLVSRDDLRDLGEHRFKDLSAPERVYQLGDGDFPPLKTLYKTNLPIPATPFLGRERELAEVVELLNADGARLVTLTGPGGTGKTRLALQAAAEASDDFSDGVYWTALAALRDPALVLPTVAHALSIPEGGRETAVDALAEHVNGKRLLVVLDNCEQVIDAAPDLSQLLARTSNLKLLVTSRETLRVGAEVEYPVPTLASGEAVALFCERARIEPSDVIAELCSRLDDLPLAIELAAARLKLLTPEQLLGRISQRLDLLKGGRDADPRQQTLRATIAWSHELLAPEEQLLFRRLAVFRGGCTLEAAEAICGAELETLESLLDKSLLRRRDGERGSRYWTLETIREYAVERLDEAGETETLRAQHADYFLALAEELEPSLMGYPSEGWALLDEIDNVRSAIEHLAAHSDPERELRLVGSLFRFWEVGGWIAEGLQVAEHALARADGVDPALRLKLLYAASICSSRIGHWEATEAYDRERIDLARSIGDRPSLAVALNDLAIDATESGDLETADGLLDESRSLASSIGENEVLATVLDNLAWVALCRRDYLRAKELAEESQAVPRAGPRGTTGVMLAFALLGLGELERARSEFDRAIEHVRRVLGPTFVAQCLDGFGVIALDGGDGARAGRLAGAAQRMRSDGAILPDILDRAQIEINEAAGRAALGDGDWEAALAEGAAMSPDDAIAYALDRDEVSSGGAS